MGILLTDLQSFGSINYFISLIKYRELIFEQYEHYRKGSYSNRYYISGANGIQLLSIPLVHENRNHSPFKDLKVSNTTSWQKQHWRSLLSAYRRSPWFEYYENELRLMYYNKYKFIIDWNFDAFCLIQKWLRMKWEIKWTTDYKKEYICQEITDERHRFLPAKNSCKQIYYPQVFEEKNGFIPNLSILDLLFCEGNHAGRILRKA